MLRFRFDSMYIFLLYLLYRPLGYLACIRIWHDNSGKGRHAGWYLNYIIVRDIQTHEKYHFILNRWLAVDEDDGMVSNMIRVHIELRAGRVHRLTRIICWNFCYNMSFQVPFTWRMIVVFPSKIATLIPFLKVFTIFVRIFSSLNMYG